MKRFFIAIFLFVILLTGCLNTSHQPQNPPSPTSVPTATQSTAPTYLDSSLPVSSRVEALLSRMTLAEKIGQMTQVEKGSITPAEVKLFLIGSVLSGGGGSPSKNTAESWAKMVNDYQFAASQTRLGIPIIYGVDAVHGHANLKGATIFPQNIGLGAAYDPGLMFRIGQATAKEMGATGIPWNFGPVVAVPQDIRWGRTYEGFSENTDLVTRLSIPYLEGLQGRSNDNKLIALATAKHYIGDGATVWDSTSTVSMSTSYKLDQGDMQLEESQVRKILLPPYQAAVDADVGSIMVSFNSWNGVKLHGSEYWLNQVLKNELGFEGFIVSDWQGIDQISGNYYQAVTKAINAGIDMNMVPKAYSSYIQTLTEAVENGDVSMDRIDDAVRRILTLKFELGLFEQPFSRSELLVTVGSDTHREIAREAVRKSLVLLKNEESVLPLPKDVSLVFVAGAHADDIGLQSGGWTIEWQGKSGNITPGTTILEAIQEAVSSNTQVIFNKNGDSCTIPLHQLRRIDESPRLKWGRPGDDGERIYQGTKKP